MTFLFLTKLIFLFSDGDSILKAFLKETANMSADDRAKSLENNKVDVSVQQKLGFNLLLFHFNLFITCCTTKSEKWIWCLNTRVMTKSMISIKKNNETIHNISKFVNLITCEACSHLGALCSFKLL